MSRSRPSIAARSRPRRILLVSSVMGLVVLCATGSALWMLYDAAFEQQGRHLAELARNRARFIEAVSRFAARHSAHDVPGGASAATLGQVREAHSRFDGFGRTGEFTLAKREGDRIVFLLHQRRGGLDERQIDAFRKLAEEYQVD